MKKLTIWACVFRETVSRVMLFIPVLALVLFAQKLFAQPLAMKPLANGVVEMQLANGMRIIVKEDHRAPTVAHMVWYKVGSMDETNGTTGVAHVLEHMMFKGTRTLKPGEFSKKVAALGGRENAFTSRDYTAYFQQVQAKDLPKVMALEADRMANLKISKDEFDKEIRVVMEERRLRTEDQARSLMYEHLMSNALQSSPYRTPVIGWMSDLQTLTHLDTKRWYDTWYSPSNALLIVAGDVQPAQVYQWAKATYGRHRARDLPLRKLQTEPSARGVKRFVLKAPAENPYLMIAFHVPKLENVQTDIDPYALEVLSAVLAGYDGARFTRQLINERRIANQASAGYELMGRGPALFLLDGTPAAGQTVESLENALLGEIRRIAEHGVEDAELSRVKANLLASQVYKLDSVFGQAMEIAAYEMSGFSYAQAAEVQSRLKAVNSEHVKAVAAKYFSEDSMTVGRLIPLPLQNKPHDAEAKVGRH
jgi:zinc protease